MLTTFRPEINDPIGAFDHLKIVLDYDNRVACVAQFHQHLQQFLDIREVQSGRRLIENVQGPTGRFLGQLGREFHALRFAAGECCAGLTESQVTETDIEQRI